MIHVSFTYVSYLGWVWQPQETKGPVGMGNAPSGPLCTAGEDSDGGTGTAGWGATSWFEADGATGCECQNIKWNDNLHFKMF